jgi:hypothetical protein
MSVVVVISQHLLNVFVQLANKRGLKKKLESVRQISRQKPAKASVVKQPKKVYCEMIGMGCRRVYNTFVSCMYVYAIMGPDCGDVVTSIPAIYIYT